MNRLSGIRQLAATLHHVVTVSPLTILPSSQETYLVKHMEKHNPERLTAPAVLPAQRKRNQSRGPTGGQNRVESADGGPNRPADTGSGGVGRSQQQQSQNYPQTETISCPFDLHQYKVMSAGDLQYKPVTIEDITSNKDLCLTVSASTIHVEHLNS